MSTIRRHGVAFHLLPTLDNSRWLEVIRESDGAVLVTCEFDGDDTDFDQAVEEWLDAAVHHSVSQIEVPVCRVCGARRREVQVDGLGRMLADQLIEWEFDLCLPCAGDLQRTSPWIRGFLLERYHPVDEEDDW